MAEERSNQLDSMRALGLAVVIFQHTMNPKGPFADDAPALALTLFFVLSGFLITQILLDARERAEARDMGRGGVLRRFYIRRFLRIFPVYYGALIIALALGEPSTRTYLFELATYQTNFLLARVGHNIAPLTPFWSLSVEEHFYILWPIIALFASRRGMWISTIAMVVISVSARAFQAFHGAPYNTITLPTYASLDGIAIGCMLAMAYRERTEAEREPWIKRGLIFGGIVVLIRIAMQLSGGFRPMVHTLHTLPFAFVSVWLIDRGARGKLPRLFNSKWLGAIGVTTYCGYVVHRYVMHFLGFDNDRGLHVFFPVILISYTIAGVSWYAFEGPINSLKRFWPYVPRPSRAAAEVGAAVQPSM